MPTNSASSPFTGALATPHALATEAGDARLPRRRQRDRRRHRRRRGADRRLSTQRGARRRPHRVGPHPRRRGHVRQRLGLGGRGRRRRPPAGQARVDALPARGADAVTVPGGVRGWEALRRFGARLTWERILRACRRPPQGRRAGRAVVGHPHRRPGECRPVRQEDFDRVFRPDGRVCSVGDAVACSRRWRTRSPRCAGMGPTSSMTAISPSAPSHYLRSRGSVLDAADFAEFQPETVDPISRRLRRPDGAHQPAEHARVPAAAGAAGHRRAGHRPLRWRDGLGALMRVFHRGNALRATVLGDPRYGRRRRRRPGRRWARRDGRARWAAVGPALVPHGDTVGVAAADGDGYAVSLIQSVYHAFGSGLIDPATGDPVPRPRDQLLAG